MSESQKSVWQAQFCRCSWLVSEVFSPLGGHKQGDTAAASTSGNGTSKNSRGGVEGRSCRGGVEEAAESRLNNLAKSKGITYLLELEV